MRQAARRPLRRTLGLTKASLSMSKAACFNTSSTSVSGLPGFVLLKALWSALCFVASREASRRQCSSRSQYKLMGAVGADSPPVGGKIQFRAFSSLSSRAGLRVFGSSGRLFRPFFGKGQCSPVFCLVSMLRLHAFQAVGCSVPHTVSPNPSVKGTSCAYAQAAPYVER